MSATDIWIVKSRHTNPNNFYVKVDGSEFYIAYWRAIAQNEQQAHLLVLEASEELVLGNTEIIEATDYQEHLIEDTTEVQDAINSAVEKFKESNETQLAAWITANGGLW